MALRRRYVGAPLALRVQSINVNDCKFKIENIYYRIFSYLGVLTFRGHFACVRDP